MGAASTDWREQLLLNEKSGSDRVSLIPESHLAGRLHLRRP